MLVGVATVAVGWFRLPVLARDTLWAEDSRLFLQQRVVLGPWASLFQPYDGYQHLVPRVLTDVAAAVAPISDYAHTVTVLALVAVGATAAATYAFTGGLVRTRVVRVVLSFVPVLLPLIPVEALGTFANLHWFALYLAPFALLHRPSTRVRAAWQTFALFAIAMTEIQAVVFVPLLLLMVRSRRSWPAGIAFLVGLAAQFTSYALLPRVRGGEPPLVLGDTVRGFFVEPSMSILWPNPASAAAHLAAHGWLLVFAVFVPFVLAAVVAVATRWSRRSLLVAALAYGIVGIWFADTVLNPTNELIAFGARGLPWIGAVGYVRYALVPSMFMLAVVALAADRLLAPGLTAPARREPSGHEERDDAVGRPADTVRTGLRSGGVGRVLLRVLGVLVLVVLLVVLVWRFVPYSTTRSLGPDWGDSVRTSEAQCDTLPGDHREFIAGAPPSWGLVLSCRDVDGDARVP